MRLDRERALILSMAALALLMSIVSFYPERLAIRLELPRVVSGDEPAYLLVVNSLLRDHDLNLSEDYLRARNGGFEAGRSYSRFPLDHHTVVIDKKTGARAYGVSFVDPSRECDPLDCSKGFPRLPGVPSTGFERFVERPSHPVLFPGILALLLFLLRIPERLVEPAAGVLVSVIASVAVLVFHTTLQRAGFAKAPRVIATTAFAIASPWIVYVKAYFAEAWMALAIVLAIFFYQCRLCVATAGALGMASAMRPLCALVGLAMLADLLIARRRREFLILAASLAIFAVAVFGVNYIQSESFIVPGNLPLVWRSPIVGLQEVLFDKAHGLIVFVPWVGLTLAAVKARPLHVPGQDLLRSSAIATGLYTVMLPAYGYSAGYCYGPRYWVPMLPMLAVLLAYGVERFGRPMLALSAVAIAVGAALNLYGAATYRSEVMWWKSPAAGLEAALRGIQNLGCLAVTRLEDFSARYIPEQPAVRPSSDGRFRLVVGVQNTGRQPWIRCPGGEQAVNLAYRIIDEYGRLVVHSGERAVLPARVEPGQTVTVELSGRAPRQAGPAVLEVSLVQEGVAWFDQRGVPAAKIVLHVPGGLGARP